MDDVELLSRQETWFDMDASVELKLFKDGGAELGF